GVEVDFFRVFLVLHAQLVEVVGAALQAAAALQAGLRLVGGQGVGRHLLGIINAADDDRLVGVAFLKSDDDFLPDPRDVNTTPLLASQQRADADPARAVGVSLPLTVPEELHF